MSASPRRIAPAVTLQSTAAISDLDFRRHDPALPRDLGGTIADVVIGPIIFRHRATGVAIAGAIADPSRARVSARGRSIGASLLCQRRGCAPKRCAPSAPMPAASASGRRRLSERSSAEIGFAAHLLGDRRVHAIAASRCY